MHQRDLREHTPPVTAGHQLDRPGNIHEILHQAPHKVCP
jgi:hypothetical protein